MRQIGLIDRYLARSIAVPLIGSLILAAMLLLLDKMLRLFQFVVDSGGPVSVVWRMLANLLPEYLSLGIPIGLMLGILLAFRKLALSSELDSMRGIGIGYGRLLRIPYAYAIPLALINLFIVGYLEPYTHYRYEGLRFDLKSGALGASIKVGEFNQLGKHLTVRIDRSENKGTQLQGIFVQMDDPSGMSVAATAEHGRFLSTDDPDTILFRLTKGRLVQDSPKFPTPRTLAFELYDLPVKLPAIDQFRRRGGTVSDELYLHELWQVGYGGGAPDAAPEARGPGDAQHAPRRSDHDADAAAARGRACGPAQAKQLVARNLPRDPDRRRLSQGQSICRAGRDQRPDRSVRRPLGAAGRPHRADLVDVPCPRAPPRRPADRRARMVRHRAPRGAFARRFPSSGKHDQPSRSSRRAASRCTWCGCS